MKVIQKTETEILKLEFEFARAMEYQWRAGTEYSATDYVRPTTPNGFEYECTDAGQTANREPEWPTTITNTQTDGSVEWTCRDFGTNGTDTISSINASADTGLTLGAASNVGTVVSFTASGGTDGTRYVVSCEVTTSASEVIEEKVTIYVSGD